MRELIILVPQLHFYKCKCIFEKTSADCVNLEQSLSLALGKWKITEKLHCSLQRPRHGHKMSEMLIYIDSKLKYEIFVMCSMILDRSEVYNLLFARTFNITASWNKTLLSFWIFFLCISVLLTLSVEINVFKLTKNILAKIIMQWNITDNKIRRIHVFLTCFHILILHM